MLQQNQAYQRGRREHGSHNGERTDAGKTVLNLFLLPLLQNITGLLNPGVHQGGFFLRSDCLGTGDFSPEGEVCSVIHRQEVSNSFPLTLAAKPVSAPLQKGCFFMKTFVLIPDLHVNFKTSSMVYRNCIVTEPWALLRMLHLWQKRKQWIYCPLCRSCGRNAAVCTCWNLIDVIARSWRTGLLSW